MKRVYWLLIAAVPVVLWWLSQGGSHQEPAAPAKPAPEPQPKPETAQEPAKDLPTPTNGTFHKQAPAEAAPVDSAPAEPTPEPAAEPVVEAPPAPPEKVEEAAEIAPPATPQIEVPKAAEAEKVEPALSAQQGEKIQMFDSKDRALEARLLDITSGQAQVICSESLPDKEKVRLVLPFGDEALTVNGQLLVEEGGVLRFKIMTMKAGQKKRFEDYLSQRLGL